MASYTWLEKQFNLKPEEAAIVEWQYRYCGGFKTKLWDCICLADKENLSKLEKAFPVEVKAYKLYSTKSGWWEKIQEKIK